MNSGSVTVKTREGKSVEVKLVTSTVYVSRVNTTDKPAAILDQRSARTWWFTPRRTASELMLRNKILAGRSAFYAEPRPLERVTNPLRVTRPP